MQWIAGVVGAFIGFHLGVYIQTEFPMLALLLGDGGTEGYGLGRYSMPAGMLPTATAIAGFFAGCIAWGSFFDADAHRTAHKDGAQVTQGHQGAADQKFEKAPTAQPAPPVGNAHAEQKQSQRLAEGEQPIMELKAEYKNETQDVDAAAIKHLLDMAEYGDAEAQFELGCIYLEGRGVPKDAGKAMKWLEQAARKGCVAAQNYVGWLHQEGVLGSRNDEQAVKWLQKAAEQGFAEAQYNLGKMCLEGRAGDDYGDKAAVMWFQKAAEQRYVEAQYSLALCYHTGRGVSKDDIQAVSWYQRAAEQGHAQAQYALIRMGIPPIAKDDVEAIQSCRDAAVWGDAQAQYLLGWLHIAGHGVSQNETQATYWFRKAAEQGHAQAQHVLARLKAH